MRLKAERRVLAECERDLEQRWETLHMDDALLHRQRAQWNRAWQDWAKAGGRIRDAAAAGRDKVLLLEMETLLAQRRTELQGQTDRLAADLGAWTKRWRAAQQFDQRLAERGHRLRVEQECASERRRDDEVLLALPVHRAAARVPGLEPRQ